MKHALFAGLLKKIEKMKKLTIVLILILICNLTEAKPYNKYWHRKHQNRIFQKYKQTAFAGKGKLSASFAPKGDHMRFLIKYW